MEAALAWYRARGAIRGPLGKIAVPTLYIWGDADDTVGRAAAEGTAADVSGPYQFEVLPGVGHFAADQVSGPGQRAAARAPQRASGERMIPKSGNRFSDKIMRENQQHSHSKSSGTASAPFSQ